MPRLDVTAPLQLNDTQLVDLARAMTTANCRYDELSAALRRYPGQEDADSCMSPNWVPLKNVESCLKAVHGEQLMRPFLSRVVENQWKQGQLREAVLERVSNLVLAPTGIQLALKDLADGVGQLLVLIAAKPAYGAVGDERVFRAVGRNRQSFVSLRNELAQLRALKGLHDALHILQIRSADWLDQTADDDDGQDPLAPPFPPLIQLVDTARQTCLDNASNLAIEHVGTSQRCVDDLGGITAQLGTMTEDGRAAGIERLRALLMREPPIIDEAIFGLSRDLPVRDIGLTFGALHLQGDPLYGNMERYRRGTAFLGEAIRGRVLEHAMWQVTDLRLYAIETILADADPGFFVRFNSEWEQVRRAIKYLSDRPPGENPPDLMVNIAIDAYDRALREIRNAGHATVDIEDALGEIAKTFASFKAGSRERFLAVDNALKADLDLVGGLKADLDELTENRVTTAWSALVPQI
jgi:hypothetical protein